MWSALEPPRWQRLKKFVVWPLERQSLESSAAAPDPFLSPHPHRAAVMSSPAAKKARRESGVGATGPDTVVVLDYGSQYTQLITRRVRELGVYSVLLPGDADMVRLDSRVVVYTDSCREYRPE